MGPRTGSLPAPPTEAVEKAKPNKGRTRIMMGMPKDVRDMLLANRQHLVEQLIAATEDCGLQQTRLGAAKAVEHKARELLKEFDAFLEKNGIKREESRT